MTVITGRCSGGSLTAKRSAIKRSSAMMVLARLRMRRLSQSRAFTSGWFGLNAPSSMAWSGLRSISQ